jgi:LPXTG-motif cell wall-anchored protein
MKRLGSEEKSLLNKEDRKMKSANSWTRIGLALTAGTIGLVFAARTSAQVQTTTSTTHGNANKEVTVERGEVSLVDGNDLFVKMEDGSIRHFPNIPDSVRITVDGKSLGIHDLKPGMKLERTITVTTTPKTVITVQTVSGKVFHVSPPNSVILTLDDGTNQSFKIPKGQKFTINGRETDAFGLKKGMKISATRIVEEPMTVIEHQREVTGKMPPPPLAPPADVPILIVVAIPAPTPAAETPAGAPTELPKTGSELPLIGLLGLACLGASLGLKLVRRA